MGGRDYTMCVAVRTVIRTCKPARRSETRSVCIRVVTIGVVRVINPRTQQHGAVAHLSQCALVPYQVHRIAARYGRASMPRHALATERRNGTAKQRVRRISWR